VNGREVERRVLRARCEPGALALATAVYAQARPPDVENGHLHKLRGVIAP
jgi:hypothetical protein